MVKDLEAHREISRKGGQAKSARKTAANRLKALAVRGAQYKMVRISYQTPDGAWLGWERGFFFRKKAIAWAEARIASAHTQEAIKIVIVVNETPTDLEHLPGNFTA